MAAKDEKIYFAAASRRLFSVKRKLERVSLSLSEILAGEMPVLPDIDHCDGLLVRSLPVDRHPEIARLYPNLVTGAARRYQRRYIPMQTGFGEYFSHFSAKTRNTLRRKSRRFADATGGQLKVLEYRTPSEVEEFLRLALPLSDRTYQQRLFHGGLRGDAASRAKMAALAEQGNVRAFLLFSKDAVAAYLYLPVSGSTLSYAHLGYEPDLAFLSPGTVLQLAALERLFAEDRFVYFDFTEGDGAHKQLFATHGVACETFVMLHPTLRNRAVLAAHAGFGKAVALGKAVMARRGTQSGVSKRADIADPAAISRKGLSA